MSLASLKQPSIKQLYNGDGKNIPITIAITL